MKIRLKNCLKAKTTAKKGYSNDPTIGWQKIVRANTEQKSEQTGTGQVEKPRNVCQTNTH